MTIEEAERKLENMRFGSIVKSYCNKVNDIERLQSKLEQAEKERWIRIDDPIQGPEQGWFYLYFAVTGNVEFGEFGSDWDEDDATHWMRLPEPPNK